MPLGALAVDIEPSPLAIASRLRGRPGFAFLHCASATPGHGPSFVAVEPVESSSAWLPPGCAEVSPANLDTRARVPRWIGVLPYECARTLERRGWTRWPDRRPLPSIVEPIWRR